MGKRHSKHEGEGSGGTEALINGKASEPQLNLDLIHTRFNNSNISNNPASRPAQVQPEAGPDHQYTPPVAARADAGHQSTHKSSIPPRQANIWTTTAGAAADGVAIGKHEWLLSNGGRFLGRRGLQGRLLAAGA